MGNRYLNTINNNLNFISCIDQMF